MIDPNTRQPNMTVKLYNDGPKRWYALLEPGHYEGFGADPVNAVHGAYERMNQRYGEPGYEIIRPPVNGGLVGIRRPTRGA